MKIDYDLSNAVPETPLWALAHVAKAAHRIEACLQRRKSEAGLADYEVRNWLVLRTANTAPVWRGGNSCFCVRYRSEHCCKISAVLH